MNDKMARVDQRLPVTNKILERKKKQTKTVRVCFYRSLEFEKKIKREIK